jgi:membrane fusion protein (multidrug efflux system)
MSGMPKAEDCQAAAPVGETPPVVAVPKARRSFLKRAILALALLAGTAAGGHYGQQYWTTGRYLESTDDAYVKTDYTTIAPKVSGYIG